MILLCLYTFCMTCLEFSNLV
ncbi:hypothetical protein LINGRAHAP2_LOCUS12458 [Linum grandiflorum]